MSTQTKIKGVIVNDDLPVLTSDGLVSKAYIDYVEALDAKGYTMSATQRSAVSAFLASLAEHGLGEYILTMFQFICSPTNKSALSVPLLGTTPFGDVSDSWGGAVVSDGEVIGVNQDTASALITLGGLIPSVNLCGVAASFKKDDTSAAGAYLDRILNFTNKFGMRLQKTSGGAERLQLYYVQDGGAAGTTIPAPSGLSDAGNGYALSMFQNPIGYVRYFKFNSGAVSDGSEVDAYNPPKFVTADLTANPTSSGAAAHATWTSVTTFKKLMTKEQAERYMSLVKTFMQALGREV